ncbi:hypothetical protein QO002_000910 [Pararhizobium capsulatum DSM 1112]|uniref:Phage gp6-like head-tail connector protein n=1 Tax=Pararhizobium capsulatum DSM 1112 TaxID=1121113 RepID=A0ABU0BPH5_9HYPH|nr:head-tail connector protein [Pararhizobium capsulatum]MDQ0318772.1 hypothetical protein [Pararhizobium capsulatum DSM 1112]
MISLDDAKAQLRVDFNDDDASIERYIAAAAAHLRRIGVDVDADPPSEDIDVAMLLLVGHFYGNREATTIGVSVEITPLGLDRLIAPHREHGI